MPAWIQYSTRGRRLNVANSSSDRDFRKALKDFLSFIGDEDESAKSSLNVRINSRLYADFKRACGKRSITRVISGLMRFYVALKSKKIDLGQ